MRDHTRPAIVRESVDLQALAREINGREMRSRGEALACARRQGEDLLRAKAACGHGNWLPWLKENIEFSGRRARQYVEFAELVAATNLDEGRQWEEWQRIQGHRPEPDLEFHPLSDLFPLIGDEDFAAFVESVKAVGLLSPITLYEGKVLDGRIRYLACKAAGVQPEFREYEGDSPVAFLLSMNLHRQHLSRDQAAAATVEAMD